MSIQVACHECDKSFKVKDRYAGLTGACPYCGTMLLVPESVDEIVVQEEPPVAGQGTSSLSLLTRVPMAPCPSCQKDILVGSPTCFYCGAEVATEDHAAASESGESLIRDQIQQARQQAQTNQ